jgi:hypothetical protein
MRKRVVLLGVLAVLLSVAITQTFTGHPFKVNIMEGIVDGGLQEHLAIQGTEYKHETNDVKRIAPPELCRQDKAGPHPSSLHSVIRENKGQMADYVSYYATIQQGFVGFGESQLFFVVNSHCFQLEFLNSNPVQPRGDQQLQSYTNYFIGNRAYTNLMHFSQVVYDDLYDGITLSYRITSEGLKYEFYVKPYADISQIQMAYIGVDDILVSTKFVELAATDEVTIIDRSLDVWYMDTGQKIASSFTSSIAMVDDSSLGQVATKIVQFSLDSAYDPSRPLIIDPLLLTQSTYLGGSYNDYGETIVLDSENNIYVTGRTASPDFPTTADAYNQTHSGTVDVFICKLSPDGSTLLYSTFIGSIGLDIDWCSPSLVLDDTNNIYVTGYTYSNDFPIVNAYDATYNGAGDGFVCKLSADGSNLLFSTLIGGHDVDYSRSITLDDANNVYITGGTFSSNFPTVNAHDATYNGGGDVFLCKLSADGSNLLYSTFIGGSNMWSTDEGADIALDSVNNIYITGSSDSIDFPTANAYDATYNEGGDAFVCKLSADGSTLLFSTFVGGNNDDNGLSLALDSENNVCVTGGTQSVDFPTVNAYDSIFNGYDVYGDAFLCRLSSDGSNLLYSTFIGGSMGEGGRSIVLDDVDNIYLTGYTCSPDFPIVDAFSPILGGDYDAFLAKLSADGATILYSSFIGGIARDFGRSIALDSADNPCITGFTLSSNFPTMNAYDTTFGGGSDTFVCKLVMNSPPLADAGPDQTANEADAIYFDAGQSHDPDDDSLLYRWDFDSDGVWDTEWSTSPVSSNIWYDDWIGITTLEITDGYSYDTDCILVTVNNMPPTIDTIVGPLDPQPVGTVITATAEFTDSGIYDTHNATWDWGDGSTSEMNLPLGARTVSAVHPYDATGVYTISLTIEDSDGGVGSKQFMYIVIYDPDGDFITGGGWFTSPAGAFAANPSLTGKASFGFVAKYKKGADIPDGQTTFVFHVANLNFHSTEYDWLVVAGPRAMFKGYGSINGQGDYGFLVSAIDGEINGGGGVDKFRIKIWDKSTEEIIYDNEIDNDETNDPTTTIEGGSIVIHKRKQD